MCRLCASIFAIGLTLLNSCPAAANDSAAELSIGGLRFTRSPDVEMVREDLKISLDRITVRYEFVNTSAAPVTLTVAFPLPDIDLSEGENISFPSNDPLNFVDFETKVDGAPIKFKIDQRAFVGDKDVTAQLGDLKIAMLPLGSQQFRPQDLPNAIRGKMVSDGLLIPAGSDERGRQLYAPGWIVKTAVVREQTFQPGKTVVVEHSYRPSVGASADTILRKPLRQDKALVREVERYRRDYCVSDEFLKELDKIAGASRNGTNIQERRISYILKTGANWGRPIRHFHLSIEKDRGLATFCPGKLVPAATKAQSFTATNFTPEQDIKFLFIGPF